MDRPGVRYRVLAARCRQSAEVSADKTDKAALLRMARGYDRRAIEVENEWRLRKERTVTVRAERRLTEGRGNHSRCGSLSHDEKGLS
jgi:hypothetical protein